MIHVHFHFSESSIADWVQAFAALLGVIGLLYTLRQGNRNIEMQIHAQRNSSKPVFRIEPKPVVQWFAGGDQPQHQFVDLVMQIERNDAIHLVLRMHSGPATFDDGSTVKLLNSMGIGSQKKVRLKLDYGYFRKEGSMPIGLTLNFMDENGYEYEQTIAIKSENLIELGKTKFLTL